MIEDTESVDQLQNRMTSAIGLMERILGEAVVHMQKMGTLRLDAPPITILAPGEESHGNIVLDNDSNDQSQASDKNLKFKRSVNKSKIIQRITETKTTKTVNTHTEPMQNKAGKDKKVSEQESSELAHIEEAKNDSDPAKLEEAKKLKDEQTILDL